MPGCRVSPSEESPGNWVFPGTRCASTFTPWRHRSTGLPGGPPNHQLSTMPTDIVPEHLSGHYRWTSTLPTPPRSSSWTSSASGLTTVSPPPPPSPRCRPGTSVGASSSPRSRASPNGGTLGRLGDRSRRAGPAAPPFPRAQHPGKELSAQGQTSGWNLPLPSTTGPGG